MTRRITLTALALALLIGLAQWRLEHPVKAQALPAYPLNPDEFTSLGGSPFASGTYTINTSMNNAAPSLSGPGITTPIAGVFFSPSGGSVARDEIAVFTFASLSIPAGVTVQGAQNANSRPMALLSQSTATVAGTINVSGAGGESGGGGDGGAAGPGGGGGGGGGEFGSGGSGGPGFVDGRPGSRLRRRQRRQRGAGRRRGRLGGAAAAAAAGVSGAAVRPYGDLSLKLQGGSGGGGGGTRGRGRRRRRRRGGDRGRGRHQHRRDGAGERRGQAAAAATEAGGGGAGGGILVHAPTVSLSGTLNATGGKGGEAAEAGTMAVLAAADGCSS